MTTERSEFLLRDLSAAPIAAADWRVTVDRTADEFWQRWDDSPQAVATPFQSSRWLRDWYATLGAQDGIEPLFVRAAPPGDDADTLLLPLIRQRRLGLRILMAPDLGVTDYNAPGFGRRRRDGAAMRAGDPWAALRAALGAHGDLLRLPKLLPRLRDAPNPLARPSACQPSEHASNRFRIDTSREAWRQGLSRQARRESDRHWRVFQRWPDARYERVRDPAAAPALIERLEAMQSARMAHRADYRLDEPPYRALYRRRLEHGVADGSAVLSCLRVGDEVIAAAYGLRHGDQLTIVRIAFAGEAWKACSPGRLLIEHTCLDLFGDGCREFDIGVGDDAYKRSFGCQRQPLLELCAPLTARGWPVAAAWHARRRWSAQRT